MFAVEERGKPEYSKKKAGYLENQQTQGTYGAENGNRTRATLVEGDRSRHCANPKSRVSYFTLSKFQFR